jgi:hypothetical protein
LFAVSVLISPTFDPTRDQPARMRVLERQRIHNIRRRPARWTKSVALAVGATQHGVDELARAESMATLGELDGLRDGGVSGNAPHVGELIHTESEQVDHIGIEARQSTADPIRENRVDPGAVAQHPVDELTRPAPIARVQRGDSPIERLVEELPSAEVNADLRGDSSRRCDATGRYCRRVHAPSIPVVGEDGTATSRRGMRPAR